MARLLVVDDDDAVLEMVAKMLGGEHSVTVAESATVALERQKEAVADGVPFELLVTDIRMAPINGFILVNQARGHQPGLRVVIMSAYYDESDEVARQVVKRYADASVSKPFSKGKLLEAVSLALDGGKAEPSRIGDVVSPLVE